MNLLESLVDLARTAAQAPDVDALKTRVVHNCAAAAGEQTESQAVDRALGEDRGPAALAFELAAIMHARTQDDFHPEGRVHVGTVVIPALIAVSADDPLPALAAGYEVFTAVASAYSAIAQQRGYRPTGMFGPIGAAAAAGTALGLDDRQMASALALASTMSAGTNQSWVDGSDEWLIEVASASRAGVDAARLAAAGVRGARNALEGAAGWSHAFFDDKGAARLRDVLASDRPRTAAVAIKPYPVSGIAQVPTHLAGKLTAACDAAEPDRIEVRMTPAELAYPGTGNRGPFRSRSDSLMSVARCVALAYLHDGAVPYRALIGPPLPAETRILQRIELVADDNLAETEAVVTVLAGAEEISEHGTGRDLLYPGWEATSRGLVELARRSEAPVDVVAGIHEVVEHGLDLDRIHRLIGAGHDR